jgi:hypothetical protein
MPKIYDNIENHLTKGLNEALELSQRTDFCVGYFNLRSWKEVADKIDSLSGATVVEGKDDVTAFADCMLECRKCQLTFYVTTFQKTKTTSLTKPKQ